MHDRILQHYDCFDFVGPFATCDLGHEKFSPALCSERCGDLDDVGMKGFEGRISRANVLSVGDMKCYRSIKSRGLIGEFHPHFKSSKPLVSSAATACQRNNGTSGNRRQ